MKPTKLKFKKQTSDAQDRIANFPDQFQEFQYLERLLCKSGELVYIDPQFVPAAEQRLNDLDRFFGFEHESQFRKTGIESSHWENRRA